MASPPHTSPPFFEPGCLLLVPAFLVWPLLLFVRLRDRARWRRLERNSLVVRSVTTAENPDSAHIVLTLANGTQCTLDPADIETGSLHQSVRRYGGFHNDEYESIIEITAGGTRHFWYGTPELGRLAEGWLDRVDGFVGRREYHVDSVALLDLLAGPFWVLLLVFLALHLFA